MTRRLPVFISALNVMPAFMLTITPSMSSVLPSRRMRAGNTSPRIGHNVHHASLWLIVRPSINLIDSF